MAERPLIMSAPMVRATLDDLKTQTRRLMKPQPSSFAPSPIACHGLDEGGFGFFDENRDYKCPYGQPGDRLWVRETWGLTCGGGWAVDPSTLTFRAGGDPPVRMIKPSQFAPIGEIQQRPDASVPGRWRPSIHMPRWASRITLEVTGVRVERLQDISEHDAIREGVDAVSMDDIRRPATWSRRRDFAQLWDRLNAKRAPWDSNPWVWVISFRRLERP